MNFFGIRVLHGFSIKLILKFFVEWGINENRLNKIKLAAKFMDRFTTKFCGFGTLTQDMADAWYATESDLETAGHELLETYLADCKEKVSTKAKTKDSFDMSITRLNSLGNTDSKNIRNRSNLLLGSSS